MSKKRTQMIQIRAFKKKGGCEGKSQLGGPWKVPKLMANGEASCLVALERFHVWWPLEEKGESSFSSLFTFPPNKFYLNLIFH